MKMLVQDMNVPIVDADTKKDRIKLLVDYFTINRNNHEWYALRFFLCELLNLVNIIGECLVDEKRICGDLLGLREVSDLNRCRMNENLHDVHSTGVVPFQTRSTSWTSSWAASSRRTALTCSR